MLIKRSALKQIALFFLMATFAFLMDKQYKRLKIKNALKNQGRVKEKRADFSALFYGRGIRIRT